MYNQLCIVCLQSVSVFLDLIMLYVVYSATCVIVMGSKAGHQEEAIVVRVDDDSGHDDSGRGVTGRARRRRRHPRTI